MRLEGVEVRRVELALRRPLATSAVVHHRRPVLYVRVVCDGAEGWGEAGALASGTAVDPAVDQVWESLTGPMIHRLFEIGGGDLPDPAAAAGAGGGGPVGRMAAAALEMAVLDCGLRAAGRTLWSWLGTEGPEVAAGAVVGIPADRKVATLLLEVGRAAEHGYQRVRLKIEPGWDLEPVRAVRQAHPTLLLQADANAAYLPGESGERSADRLGALDPFGLACIEQPLDPDDLAAHAALAARLDTPVCLDESLTTLDRLEEAIGMGACEVACIKPARLGGLTAAMRAEAVCREAGVPAFVGGLFETGLGRSANAALAGLGGFTLPGDLSDPADYLEESPFGYPHPVGGRVRPPASAGVAPAPDPAVLAARTAAARWFPAG
jgi:O-succinylbenzoate synthase